LPLCTVLLRSAARRRLVVPRHRLSTYGRRTFAVAGPMTFNVLPDELRDPTVNTTTFRRLLKAHFSRAIYTSSALEVKTYNALYKSTLLTYLLTYVVRL